jgi:hypothetical protein
MTNKIIQGAKEALAFAKGENITARVTVLATDPDGNIKKATREVNNRSEVKDVVNEALNNNPTDTSS